MKIILYPVHTQYYSVKQEESAKSILSEKQFIAFRDDKSKKKTKNNNSLQRA